MTRRQRRFHYAIERCLAIFAPSVVRRDHREFAGEVLFDAVRVLLDGFVTVEEVIEQRRIDVGAGLPHGTFHRGLCSSRGTFHELIAAEKQRHDLLIVGPAVLMGDFVCARILAGVGLYPRLLCGLSCVFDVMCVSDLLLQIVDLLRIFFTGICLDVGRRLNLDRIDPSVQDTCWLGSGTRLSGDIVHP
ncbi:hypothetical protein [Paraburkholderia sp. RL17-381-BIF-C]|uniref:hypothetical protein n=1 Tax=Paraburkholderia sp. RL17-381-BIF-C TaxID=3031635 RepID=UPI0038BC90C9